MVLETGAGVCPEMPHLQLLPLLVHLTIVKKKEKVEEEEEEEKKKVEEDMGRWE